VRYPRAGLVGRTLRFVFVAILSWLGLVVAAVPAVGSSPIAVVDPSLGSSDHRGSVPNSSHGSCLVRAGLDKPDTGVEPTTEPQVGAETATRLVKTTSPPDACAQGIDSTATGDDDTGNSVKDGPTDTSTTRLLIAALHSFPGPETPPSDRSVGGGWSGSVTDHGYGERRLLRVVHDVVATKRVPCASFRADARTHG
jgi:hypothetical protein